MSCSGGILMCRVVGVFFVACSWGIFMCGVVGVFFM